MRGARTLALVRLVVLRVDESMALVYQIRQVLESPLSPLLQHVVHALAGFVRPSGAADLHVVPQLRLDVSVEVGLLTQLRRHIGEIITISDAKAYHIGDIDSH